MHFSFFASTVRRRANAEPSTRPAATPSLSR